MLDGCRILLVEDEYLLAQDLRHQLEDARAVVLGPEPSVEQALARIRDEPRIDGAVLDVNLGGEPVFAVADALVARRVPFLFASGYEDDVIKSRFPDAVTCDKPLDTRHLLRTLERLLSTVSGDPATDVRDRCPRDADITGNEDTSGRPT